VTLGTDVLAATQLITAKLRRLTERMLDGNRSPGGEFVD